MLLWKWKLPANTGMVKKSGKPPDLKVEELADGADALNIFQHSKFHHFQFTRGVPRKLKINEHEITFSQARKGATHKEKRLGRGEASGKGGTSTKGNKGGQSRAGYKNKKSTRRADRCLSSAVFQNVVFENNHRVEYKVFNIGQMDHLAEKYGITEFSLQNLYINSLHQPVWQCKDPRYRRRLKGKFTFQGKCHQRQSQSSHWSSRWFNCRDSEIISDICLTQTTSWSF